MAVFKYSVRRQSFSESLSRGVRHHMRGKYVYCEQVVALALVVLYAYLIIGAFVVALSRGVNFLLEMIPLTVSL